MLISLVDMVLWSPVGDAGEKVCWRHDVVVADVAAFWMSSKSLFFCQFLVDWFDWKCIPTLPPRHMSGTFALSPFNLKVTFIPLIVCIGFSDITIASST